MTDPWSKEHRIVVSDEAFEMLLRMLDEPPEVSPQLVALFKKHRQKVDRND